MMIDFVVYFSTADDKVGYVVAPGYGTAPAEFTGGPALPHGTYRVERGTLIHVAEPLADDNQSVVVAHER